MTTCAHRKCRRKVTQAWDVGSWFKAPTEQNLTHFEVCDKHASYFDGSFDRRASERVAKDLVAAPSTRSQEPEATA